MVPEGVLPFEIEQAFPLEQQNKELTELKTGSFKVINPSCCKTCRAACAGLV